MRRSIGILWVVVIILLGLNLALLYALNLARLTAIETLNETETTLDKLTSEIIVYNVEVNQAVPVKADVPINQTIQVPLNTVIPIDQVVKLPFKTGDTQIELEMPIKADFPIDLVVPVQFDNTINVETTVQLNTTVPVKIELNKTPLTVYIEQMRREVQQLKNRLMWPAEVTPIEAAEVVSESLPGVTSTPIATPQIVADVTPTETVAKEKTPAITPEPHLPVVSTNSRSDEPSLSICEHAYWPFRLGTGWTYNSSQTSFTQTLDKSQDNRVYLSTQYEGQPVEYSLECYQEGLSGNFAGEIRRLTELGALNFKHVQGLFLPHPEVMEQLGTSWKQEFEVTGTIPASQGGQPVIGQVQHGQAAASYTPTGFETLETLLGPREALRIEQRLEVNLKVNFQLSSQALSATELVHLTNVYWFVKGIGLVKVHWQGGTIQYQFDNPVLNQQVSVPALVADQLVLVCFLSEQKVAQCIHLTGIEKANLTPPPESELVIPPLILPGSLAQPSADTPETVNPVPSITSPSIELPSESTSAPDRSALLAYAEAVARLGEKISDAGNNFGQAALGYRNNELSLIEFKDKFSSFASPVRDYINEIDHLSPPPEAEQVHKKLTGGLDKCDEAIELMDEWFDTQNSDTRDATMLLVANCMDQVTQAGDELKALLN